MKNIAAINWRFLRRTWFVLSLLALIFVCECLSMHTIKAGWGYSGAAGISAVAIAVLILFFIAMGLATGNYKWPSSTIIGKFISNDIRGSYVPVLLLLAFIAQFSWCLDILLDIIFNNTHYTWVSFWDDVLYLIPPALSMIATLFLFPFRSAKKESLENKDTIVSAISAGAEIQWKNIDLLLKPLISKVGFGDKVVDKLNIRHFYVIPSHEALEKRLQRLPEEVSLPVVRKIFESEEAVNEISCLIDDYNKNFPSEAQKEEEMTAGAAGNPESVKREAEVLRKKRKNDLEELLRCICRHIKAGDVNFHFADGSDYNVFEDVWRACQNIVNDIDGERLLLYINPGTNVPSSVMAIESLIGDRMLLYAVQRYNQNKPSENQSEEPSEKQQPDIICISQNIWTINEWYGQLSDDYNS